MGGREQERRQVGRPIPGYGALEAASVKFYGRMAGMLFLISSIGALPSAYLLAEPNDLPLAAYALPIGGLLTGVVLLLIPWERFAPTWLHALWIIAIVQIFAITHLTGDHLAILYLLVMAWAAYVYRRAITVFVIGAACVAALILGILIGPGELRHAAGVAIILSTTLIALGVTAFFARSKAQDARREAAETTAEVLRVSLSLQRGREHLGRIDRERVDLMKSLLLELDAFKLALRESPIRIDSAVLAERPPA